MYFAKWRVNRAECGGVTRNSAEERCTKEIMWASSLAQGELHKLNCVTVPLGAGLTVFGGYLLKSGSWWGLVPLAPGLVLDYITIRNVEKVFDIGDNADRAIEMYCDCKIFDGNH